MAVYKVIQDIESEDKLLGPLTLKGFVYAIIAGTCAFIEFKLLFLASPLKYAFILLFAFPMILFGVLASPLGREQPTEVWLLSRIRFFLKPRGRIWDQEGVNDLITITAPKKLEKHLVKDLSQQEVHSRLKTLATTLDTRGWAVKNVDVNLNSPEVQGDLVAPSSDRLVSGAAAPHQMPVVDVRAADDILDEKNNPTAQKFEAMMQKAAAERKHGLLTKLRGLVEDDDSKAKKPQDTKKLPGTKVALSRAKKSKEAQLKKIKEEKDEELQKQLNEAAAKFAAQRQALDSSKHKFLSEDDKSRIEPKNPSPPALDASVTAARQTVNMELAQSGNAFSVATLSSLANREPKIQQTGPNEVTISLH